MTRLTHGEGFDVEPAWSPDGTIIAYINTANFFTGRLQLIRSDDGSPIKLPVEARVQGQLYFAPDGRRILGKFKTATEAAQIAWFELETGQLIPIAGAWRDTPIFRADRIPFALSPDGKWIAYGAHLDVAGEQDGNDGPQADLWRLPAEGGTAEKLVRFPGRVHNLCWDVARPDLYLTTELGTAHRDLWRVPVDGAMKEARQISFGQGDEDWPSINREGTLLIHTENNEGATALRRYDPASGRTDGIAIDGIDFRQPTGRLRLKVIEKATHQPTVAKILLRQKDGKFHAPIGALYRITQGALQFYCREENELILPAGKYEVVALRGLEYRAGRTEFDLRADQTREQTIELERWTDMTAIGWYSGENHIHANYGYGAWYHRPASVLDQCEGEDLNVCNVMVANSDGDGVFDREFFRGQPDHQSQPRTLLYWNEEFRSTLWGHMTLISLQQLVEPIFTGFKDTTNPWDIPTNGDIADRTRQQSAVVSYTHPASNPDDLYLGAYSAKGLPVDAALGRIDTLDVMGPGYDASVRLWYRLLNCGFRLPAAAGTDCFLNRIASVGPGWGRSYVHVTNGFSYHSWIAAQKAGRSFVSNGPMLQLSVDDADIGQILHLSGPRRLKLKGKVWSQHPLEKMELIYNGRSVIAGKIGADGLTGLLDDDLPVTSSGWIALRAVGRTPPYHVGPNLSAHTSPVYLEFQGQSTRAPQAADDARFFLAWIDRLEAALMKRNRVPGGLDHAQMQLAAARAVYDKIAKAAKPSAP